MRDTLPYQEEEDQMTSCSTDQAAPGRTPKRSGVIGQVRRDPELVYSSRGRPCVQVSLDLEHSDRPLPGRQQPGRRLTVTAWEQLALELAQKARKGSRIAVEGRITCPFMDESSTFLLMTAEAIAFLSDASAPSASSRTVKTR
ncbi:MAG: single-stranded DNA-binding protein [Thermogemmatispora sp.]|nr:single-stranded DNA-binding protein [Thermogemmatispora sp.]